MEQNKAIKNILSENIDILDDAIKSSIKFKATPSVESRKEFLDKLGELPNIVLADLVNGITLSLIERRNKEIKMIRNIEEFDNNLR